MDNAFALCALCWYCVSRVCIKVKAFMPRLVRIQLSPLSVVRLQGSVVNPGYT